MLRLGIRKCGKRLYEIGGNQMMYEVHPNLAQVYRHQVERLQDALNEPEIRDEALQILRGLVERVSIGPAENGLEIEIVGEIAKMIELGIENQAKRATLDEEVARSVKMVAGTRNHLDLQLASLVVSHWLPDA